MMATARQRAQMAELCTAALNNRVREIDWRLENRSGQLMTTERELLINARTRYMAEMNERMGLMIKTAELQALADALSVPDVALSPCHSTEPPNSPRRFRSPEK